MSQGTKLMRDFKKFFPEVYSKIIGTASDPTDNDERIGVFWVKVREIFEEHWNSLKK